MAEDPDGAPLLSNVREILGWLIGRTIVEVTAGDPPDLPDADPEDANDLVLHFDNGATLTVCAECGVSYNNPDAQEDPQ